MAGGVAGRRVAHGRAAWWGRATCHLREQGEGGEDVQHATWPRVEEEGRVAEDVQRRAAHLLAARLRARRGVGGAGGAAAARGACGGGRVLRAPRL